MFTKELLAYTEEYEHCYKALKFHMTCLDEAEEMLSRQVELKYIQREAKHMDRLLRRIKALSVIKQAEES